MASLTQSSIIARKIIRFAIYLVILIVVVRVTFATGTKVFRIFFPEPPPKPTVTFGKLTALPFPENLSITEGLTFTLETAEGKLPEFTGQIRVFFMPKAAPNIQGLEFAKQKAVAMGFSPEGRELVESVFLFPNRNSPSTLNMEIVSGIFSISYNLPANPRALDENPPSADTATSQVRSFLARAGFLVDDLSGPVEHDFIKIEEGRFVNALSQSDGQITKINLYRKGYEDLPSAPLDPDEANVWFMIGGSRERADQIIAAEYHYYPIDEEQSATYPIITAEFAWKELTQGGGFIVGRDDENQLDVTIRNVYLAYFDPGQYTEFYQPIVVFEGDGGFVAYVPAVTPEYYGE